MFEFPVVPATVVGKAWIQVSSATVELKASISAGHSEASSCFPILTSRGMPVYVTPMGYIDGESKKGLIQMQSGHHRASEMQDCFERFSPTGLIARDDRYGVLRQAPEGKQQ